MPGGQPERPNGLDQRQVGHPFVPWAAPLQVPGRKAEHLRRLCPDGVCVDAPPDAPPDAGAHTHAAPYNNDRSQESEMRTGFEMQM
jgi:hypothetical protein